MNTSIYKDGVLYTFCLHDSKYHNGFKNYITMVITTDTSERVINIPVNEIDGYTVKINKKSVSAAGGARGLFCFIGDCIKNDFMLAWVAKIIRNFSGVDVVF